MILSTRRSIHGPTSGMPRCCRTHTAFIYTEMTSKKKSSCHFSSGLFLRSGSSFFKVEARSLASIPHDVSSSWKDSRWAFCKCLKSNHSGPQCISMLSFVLSPGSSVVSATHVQSAKAQCKSGRRTPLCKSVKGSFGFCGSRGSRGLSRNSSTSRSTRSRISSSKVMKSLSGSTSTWKRSEFSLTSSASSHSRSESSLFAAASLRSFLSSSASSPS